MGSSSDSTSDSSSNVSIGMAISFLIMPSSCVALDHCYLLREMSCDVICFSCIKTS
jgi:hypothetical protein